MIRRLIAFALLVAAGFVGLQLAVGDDDLLGSSQAEPFAKEPGDDRPKRGRQATVDPGGVAVDAGADRGQLQVVVEGGFEGPQFRRIDLPDGGHREVTRYWISVRDSRQRPDGTWQFEGLRMKFYELHGDDPAAVRAVESGLLVARLALAELGLDQNGQRSIAADKDIDLYDAVLTTLPGARVPGLRIEMARALVRNTDTEVLLRTPTPDMPFTLDLAGDEPVHVTGRGAFLRVPAGAEQADAEIVVRVESRPVLVRRTADGQSRVTATGPMDYRESTRTGVARVVAEGDVRIEGQLDAGGRADAQGEFLAIGDRLDATLRRARTGDARTGARWTALRLVGDSRPATLRLGPERPGRKPDLTCRELTVVPNAAGAPYLFTADVGPSMRLDLDGRALDFDAGERIHIIDVQRHLDPWLAPFGFRRGAFPVLARRLVVFTGETRVALPHEGRILNLHAADGMRVLMSDSGERDGPMVVLGNGEVRVDSAAAGGARDEAPLSVRGKRGFRMFRGQDGIRLQIGSDEKPDEVRIDVQGLALHGTGACELFQPTRADAPARLSLTSAARDVVLTVEGAELRRIASLEASFRGGELVSLNAHGAPCELFAKADAGEIVGAAAEITSDDPAVFVLHGVPGDPARLARSADEELLGDRIRVVRLGPRDALLIAEGDARVDARVQRETGPPGRFDLRARQLLALPHLIPPAALAPFAVPLPPHLRPLLAPRWRTRVVVAKHDVTVRSGDAQAAADGTAAGEHLLLHLDPDHRGLRGILRGQPARVTRRDPQHGELGGQADVVRIENSAAGERLAFLPVGERRPRFLVPNAAVGSGLGKPDGRTEVVCDGEIDVRDAVVRFGGPVRARALRADGELDPDGLQLDAARLRLERDPRTGALLRLIAGGPAELRLGATRARGAQLTVDLRTHQCEVVDPAGGASFSRPGTLIGYCSRALFDYVTGEFTVWHARARRGGPER